MDLQHLIRSARAKNICSWLVGWPSVKDDRLTALLERILKGVLRFNFRAGQIGHKVANDSLPLQHFFKNSCVTEKFMILHMNK